MPQPTTDMTTIQGQIILALEKNGGEVEGTERLAAMLNCIDAKTWVRHCARHLEVVGAIVIIKSNGGRGLTTVYKRIRRRERG